MSIKRVVRRILLFLIVAICTTLICCVAATQSNLAQLVNLGVDIPLGDRLRATGHDIVSMGPVYAVLIAAALVVAFPVAGLLSRWAANWRLALYVLAGFVAVGVLLATMKQVLGINVIAAARTMPGFLAQMIAGGFGGWLFAKLTRKRQGA